MTQNEIDEIKYGVRDMTTLEQARRGRDEARTALEKATHDYCEHDHNNSEKLGSTLDAYAAAERALYAEEMRGEQSPELERAEEFLRNLTPSNRGSLYKIGVPIVAELDRLRLIARHLGG